MGQIRKDANFLLPTALHAGIVNEILKLPRTTFKLGYLQDCLLSKFTDKDSGTTPAQRQRAAIEKWLSVEKLNAKTNKRLWESEAWFSVRKPNYRRFSSEQVLARASKIIVKIIGEEPDLDLLLGSFSNGATTSKRRGVGMVARKYVEKADVTYACWLRTVSQLRTYEGWRAYSSDAIDDCRIVTGNILFTVPKNSEIDRVAAKEPDLNMFAQRAVGDYFRSRLKRRAGLDLNDQSRNRSLARLWQQYATIDLSSASDTVTTSLVARLLPSAWFKYLDDIRSRYTGFRGKYHENAMFSSMGNGFTFELETLVFFSLAKAISQLARKESHFVSVYGDDIICHNDLAPTLVQCFQYFGFRANRTKSFWTGGFRESCGGHYHFGEDVTPIYLKSKIVKISDLIHFLNRLRIWLSKDTTLVHEDVYAIYRKYVNYVPKRLRGGFEFDRYSLVTTDLPSRKLQTVKQIRHKDEIRLQTGLYLSVLRNMAEAKPSKVTSRLSLRAWALTQLSLPEPREPLSVEVTRMREVRVDLRPVSIFGLRSAAILYEEWQST